VLTETLVTIQAWQTDCIPLGETNLWLA